MLVPGVAEQQLASELACAVRAERIRGIAFDVGAALGAIEHVVGADVHQRCIELATSKREVMHTQRVDGKGLGRVAFDVVHAMEGRAVNDDVGLEPL